jgi:tRNA (guanine-N7-)-methyltransferase
MNITASSDSAKTMDLAAPDSTVSGRRKPQAQPMVSSMIRLASIVEPLPMDALFPSMQPLEVELGCGDGTFLIQYSKAHPDRNFLGLERLLGRIRKCDRKAFRAGLKNVKLLRLEASYTLQFMLPPESVGAIHVYFPDPWPKRRHHDRRLVNASFMDAALKALVPGGVLYLRTDDPDYFKQMLASGKNHAGFQPVETPADLAAFITDFERNFNARGIPTLRTAYRKPGGE